MGKNGDECCTLTQTTGGKEREVLWLVVAQRPARDAAVTGLVFVGFREPQPTSMKVPRWAGRRPRWDWRARHAGQPSLTGATSGSAQYRDSSCMMAMEWR